MPPTFVEITGNPQAKASNKDKGILSLFEGFIKISAVFNISPIIEFGTLPINSTSFIFSLCTMSIKWFFNLPSPTNLSLALGIIFFKSLKAIIAKGKLYTSSNVRVTIKVGFIMSRFLK